MSAALEDSNPAPGTFGTVFLMASQRPGDRHDDHGALTRIDLGGRIAAVLGYGFDGEHRRRTRAHGSAYFIPADTVLESDARALGIRGEQDLFGGVVPHAFLATKTISHPAVDPAATVPAGRCASCRRTAAADGRHPDQARQRHRRYRPGRRHRPPAAG